MSLTSVSDLPATFLAGGEDRGGVGKVDWFLFLGLVLRVLRGRGLRDLRLVSWGGRARSICLTLS